MKKEILFLFFCVVYEFENILWDSENAYEKKKSKLAIGRKPRNLFL